MIIKGETQIKEHLERLTEVDPKVVIRRLEKGSQVQKSFGLFFEIDDPDVDKKLGDFPIGAVPYHQIYTAFKESKGKTGKLFGSECTAPFSRFVEAGVGECIEKAILVHLSAQRGRDAFLINGCLTQDGVLGIGPHGFNVVFKDRKPYLVDAHNPYRGTGEIQTKNYIAPIIGIDNDFTTFIVPDEWKIGRTYTRF